MTLRNLVAQAHIETPLGPVTLAASADGLAGLWFDGQKHHPGALDAPQDEAQTFIAQAIAELQRYWRGGSGSRFEGVLRTGFVAALGIRRPSVARMSATHATLPAGRVTRAFGPTAAP